MTREQWLNRAVKQLVPLFAKAGFKMPPDVRVSVGFAYGSRKAQGQSWSPKCSADKANEQFISPAVADPLKVLSILVHELVHAVVGHKHGHKTPFRQCALLVGLEGKMSATHAGTVLVLKLNAIKNKLGAYPHAKLNPGGEIKKQTTRLKKMLCMSCGCIIRTTEKWLEMYGSPWTCPCGNTPGLICPDEDY